MEAVSEIDADADAVLDGDRVSEILLLGDRVGVTVGVILGVSLMVRENDPVLLIERLSLID